MKTLCLKGVYLQCLHEYKCVHAEVKPGHHMSSITFHFTVLRQGLSLNQKLSLLPRLAGKLANGTVEIHLSLHLNVGDDLTCSQSVYYAGAGDLNSGPHACRPSTHTTELSPQPL